MVVYGAPWPRMLNTCQPAANGSVPVHLPGHWRQATAPPPNLSLSDHSFLLLFCAFCVLQAKLLPQCQRQKLRTQKASGEDEHWQSEDFFGIWQMLHK